MAKKMFEKIRPVRRDRMSVRRPLRGWRAALAIRYAEASHESKPSELKDVEMGADSVAIIVESTLECQANCTRFRLREVGPSAARKHPIQIEPSTSKSLAVLGSSAMGTPVSPSSCSPLSSVPSPTVP